MVNTKLHNVIKNNKNIKKQPVFSEEKAFLIHLYNNTKAEIKKANKYLAAFNHNLKIIKILLSKVKN